MRYDDVAADLAALRCICLVGLTFQLAALLTLWS